ncbi:GNAT family N-acetyltransferase [Sphaerisporangium rubeum]|uniref:Ribosomal protein S18 acetylase RimI-like enzyme n=1 Tax=Sphaerisporangium rubeum TaxID=321317 RepID=A0A7X0IKD3_9ACTN|nr:GNAT family N-acetyltransferase [Sphaerisporangium rubeum]MBB6476558.1 ribosomal protein S18 acetylase RimI-like enzyme [Sphaerisporangium rubeum]
MLPQDYLDGLSVEEDAEQRRKQFGRNPKVRNVVAERDGAVVGWVVTGPCRDVGATGLDGEIYALYVAPAMIGTGVGRELVRHVIARARSAGLESMYLWVLEENHRARRFYEAAGFVPDGERGHWHMGGASVPELRYMQVLSGVPTAGQGERTGL